MWSGALTNGARRRPVQEMRSFPLRVVMLAVAFVLLAVPAQAKGHGGGGSHAKSSSPSKPSAPKPTVAKPSAPVHVSAYTKPSTGKTAIAHTRTAPNQTQKDNYSAKGNVNPTTGKPGTKPITH